MQNNNRKNLKAKGYYILLAALALVAGVSGFIFLSDALPEQKETAALSVPVEEPPAAESAAPQPPAAEEKKESVPTLGVSEQPVVPVSGDVLEGFAADKLTYHATTRDWRVHHGVDLAAEQGQEVRAAKSGTVLAVYEDDYYGVTVVLQHEDGYTTAYCGLAEEPAVAAGEDVTAGETVGLVGSTALIESALESHLHFEVCKDGEPIDPASFLYGR